MPTTAALIQELPTNKLSTPDRRLLIREGRALLDLATVPLRLLRPKRRLLAAPTIVLPGFGAGEKSTRPLRYFLKRHGLHVEDWGLGTNRAGLDRPHTLDDLSPNWNPAPLDRYNGEGGVSHLTDLMVARIRERSQALGSSVALVGWSLGGTIAREVARDVPECVSQVVTLGSPFIWRAKIYRSRRRAAATRAERRLDRK